MSAARAGAAVTRSALVWRGVAVAVIVGIALLCWNQIARTLGSPIFIQLSYGGGGPTLPRPTGGPATVSDYQIGSATMDVTHISGQLRLMIALGIVLQFILIAAVLLTIGVVWVRTSAGRPFARSVTASLVVLAVLVAVVGSTSDVLQQAIANREAYEAVGNNNIDGYYSMVAGFQFSGLSLIVALGIGLLASAFAIGARLTRDTEGLV
jgi:hypothetical protein